jgi:hypothetical protein
MGQKEGFFGEKKRRFFDGGEARPPFVAFCLDCGAEVERKE